MSECKHGISLFADWCSMCNGSPGSNNIRPVKKKVIKSKDKAIRTGYVKSDSSSKNGSGIIFNYKLNTMYSGEHEIYINDSIFCHLSESSFDLFKKMVHASGNFLMRRL